MSLTSVSRTTADEVIAQKTKQENDPAAFTWTEPEKAAAEDPDFLIQGEYGIDGPDAAWGIQVVALGAGAFDAYLLENGLPGLGWTRAKKRIRLSGIRSGKDVQLSSEDKSVTAVIRRQTISVSQNGSVIADLPRIQRTSPTLGAKPTREAIVLFDGSSTDAWIEGVMENGLLANTNVATKEHFRDYTLHLEFRTPYKPFARGQQRGNSGVYHQGRYETQVLDSFGLEGFMNETGGLYSIADPILNMCLPPLVWQTYDVDFTAARFDAQGVLARHARITVKLNGVIVQGNQELPKTTPAARVKKITPQPGPLFLQHHNNPVFYRNIWVAPKTASATE